jgi:hypothetical protein
LQYKGGLSFKILALVLTFVFVLPLFAGCVASSNSFGVSVTPAYERPKIEPDMFANSPQTKQPSATTTTNPSAEHPTSPPNRVNTPASAATASANPAVVVPLMNEVLSPSTTAQQISWNDQVTVSIPGGLLTKSEPMTISRVDNAPPSNFEGFAPLATYDISMGNLKEFEKKLTIEIAYDPAKLPGALPPEDSICAEWWDPGQNTWWRTPCMVDSKRHRVVISTDHLSRWRIEMVLRGDQEWPSQHFIVVWNPGEYPVIGKAQQYPKEFAKKVSGYLEAAWQTYFTERYAVAPGSTDETWPTDWPNNIEIGKTWVVIDQGMAESETGSISGDITLKSSYNNEDQLKQDTAHELFHSTHLRKVRMPTYIQSQWWADAAADYAATRIAWHNLPGMPLISGDYFRSSLMTVDYVHEYETARFIEFLVSKGVAFTPLFNEMAQSVPTTESLAAIVQNMAGKSLLEQYRDFVLYVCFDSDGPIETRALEPSLHEGAVGPKKLPKSFEANASEISFTSGCLENYAAWIWGFKAGTSKITGEPRTSVQVTVKGGNLVNDHNFFMGVYVLKNDRRIPGGTIPQWVFLAGSGSAEINVSDGDIVYILAVNADTKYHSWDLEVRDSPKYPKIVTETQTFSWDFYTSNPLRFVETNRAEVSITWEVTNDTGVRWVVFDKTVTNMESVDIYVKPNTPTHLTVTAQCTVNPTQRKLDYGENYAMDIYKPVFRFDALNKYGDQCTVNKSERSATMDITLSSSNSFIVAGAGFEFLADIQHYSLDGTLFDTQKDVSILIDGFEIAFNPEP